MAPLFHQIAKSAQNRSTRMCQRIPLGPPPESSEPIDRAQTSNIAFRLSAVQAGPSAINHRNFEIDLKRPEVHQGTLTRSSWHHAHTHDTV